MMAATTIRRATHETEIELVLDVSRADTGDGVTTGEPFLDHMLRTLARYGGFGLRIGASGDMRHHLIEDVAITMGLALREQTTETCARFGHAVVPMDDALVEATVDLGGRFYYQGPVPSTLYDHFLRSLAENARMTLHVRVRRGRDRHHAVEAAFKALGLALRQALVREGAVFSTKGAVRLDLGTGGGGPPAGKRED